MVVGAMPFSLRPHAAQPPPGGPAAEDAGAVDLPSVVLVHEAVDAGDHVAVGEEKICGNDGVAALEMHRAEFHALRAAHTRILGAREVGEGLDVELLLEVRGDLPVGAGVVVFAKGSDLFPDDGVERIGRNSLTAAPDLVLDDRARAADGEEPGEEEEFGGAVHEGWPGAASAARRRR